MAYQGIPSPAAITDELNGARFDVKRAIRVSQAEISQIISDMGDETKTTIVIDGKEIKKSDTITLSLAVQNKMDSLQNQTTTILSVFSQLFSMEKSLGGATGS